MLHVHNCVCTTTNVVASCVAGDRRYGARHAGFTTTSHPRVQGEVVKADVNSPREAQRIVAIEEEQKEQTEALPP
eukprot:1159943-Prorocentrum_minimum.AAC.3